MVTRAVGRRPGRAWVKSLIVILGVCFASGLFLTVIARTRNATAQAQCHNNLRAIAFSAQNYESMFGHFPSGTMPNADLPPERRLSWLFELVPVMESTDLYHRVDQSAAWDSEQNRAITSISFRSYTCPTVGKIDTSIGTYLGIAGIGPDAAVLPTTDPRAGMFGYDRATKRSEITDGESTTAIVIESPTAGPWAQGGTATVRGFDPSERPHLGPGRPFGGHVAERPWFSRNTFGTNVSFVDGSARFLTESIDPVLLEHLSTVSGKEELPPDW